MSKRGSSSADPLRLLENYLLLNRWALCLSCNRFERVSPLLQLRKGWEQEQAETMLRAGWVLRDKHRALCPSCANNPRIQPKPPASSSARIGSPPPFDFDNDDKMPPEQMKGPTVVVRTQVLLSEFAAKTGRHYFGGPLDLDVRWGPKMRKRLSPTAPPPKLHRLITLNLSDPLLRQLRIKGVAELPLVYGFLYSGCEMTYRVTGDGRIDVLEQDGSAPSDGWPYEKYPQAFPAKRFNLRDAGKIAPAQVDELTWQGIMGSDPKKGALAAIVPPSRKYGVSLWGEHGDAETVQVIFEIDPKARTVRAYNQCT